MKRSLLFLFLSSFFVMCSQNNDGPKLDENGLTPDINKIISQDVIDEFFNLDFPIYSGVNPPELSNTYLFSPAILKASNLSGDVIGRQYNDIKIEFKDFNRELLKVRIVYQEGSGSILFYDGFIVGDGQSFSVFCVYTASNGVITARVFSGNKTVAGIQDFSAALYLIDNNDQPGYIADGSCRTFVDGDIISGIIDQLVKGAKGDSVSYNTETEIYQK